MSMKNAFKASILFFGLAANVAHAESIADQVISQLTAQGYERIEIYNSPTEVRVEATKGGRVLEVVYDAVTGQILHQEVSRFRTHNQNMTVAARAMADRNTLGHRSYRVATRRQSLSLPNILSMRLRRL
jgi:hypothetical protein